MKGKEIITHAVRAEMPDMEQLRNNSIRQAMAKETVKNNIWVKRLAPATACLAVVLVAVIALIHLNSNNINMTGTISGAVSDNKNNTPIDFAMRGLPVENFNLADVENSGIAMNRMVFMNFGSLFEWGADCFVVIKVNDIQKVKEEHQISDITILQSIYGECETNTVQIKQYIYENHFCLGTTNLLRKGGAYILPLAQSDGKWHIIGDMDVLFEIDDTGKVWSHSDFEDFNRFDGKSIESLLNELQEMFSNDDFMLVTSPFSNTLRSWTLADITISDKSDKKTDENGFSYFNYSFIVHEILFNPNYNNSTSFGKTGNIKVYADDADMIKRLSEKRYLMFLDRYEGEIHLNSRMIAKVGNDESITALPAPDDRSYLGASVFTSYNGYKISDFREMVLRINLWRESDK